MVVDRVIVRVGAKADGLAEIVAARSAAIEAGAIVADVAADGTIGGRFAMNNGPRLGPKSAGRRKPTIISHSSKRPRKSSKSIVSTWK